ncbi:MAG: TraR/DksA family transcriptional regulator [Nitrospira sp.]
MMNQADLQDFRAKLAAMQDEVRAISASAAHDLKPVALDQTSVGRVSRMDAMHIQQMSRETERRRQQLLAKIEGRCAAPNQGDLACAFSARRRSTFAA